MLELLAAVVVSQAPVMLQAVVPTSGAGATTLLDGKADTTWSPEGDAEGEGVLFRFEGEVKLTQIAVQPCAKGSVSVRPFINGTERAAVTFGPGKATPVATFSLSAVRSVFLRLDQGSCLADVVFKAGDATVPVSAPRTLDVAVQASSVLAPADAYHPGYLFDGRPDFGWVEGAKGPGVGESMTLTFPAPVTLTALEVWNGYQRSDDHFKKNARAKKLELTVDGAPPIELTLRDAQGSQKLALPKAATTSSLKLTIKDVYRGSKYEDLVLSELRVWDDQGPRALATTELAQRAAALKAEVAKTPLAALLDQNFRSVCQRDDYELEAKFRSNHSFVVYRSADEDAGHVKEVLDGTFIVKPGKGLELFGRSHRNETSFDPYGSAGGRETTSITGGALTVTRVADLSKADYLAKLTLFNSGPLNWSLSCDAAKNYEALAKQDAFVIEGRALTAIVVH